jgi:hypothetical protein
MVTYDLIVIPVEQPITADEAAAEIEKLSHGFQVGIRRDHRLDAFVDGMDERWPGLAKAHEWERPFEFDAMRHHVFVGVPPASAVEVAAVVAETAWSTGVAVFDPQRHVIGLPAPHADAPLTTDGIAELVEAASSED